METRPDGIVAKIGKSYSPNLDELGDDLKMNQLVKHRFNTLRAQLAEAQKEIERLRQDVDDAKTSAAVSSFCSDEWKNDLDKLKLNNLKNAILGIAEKMLWKDRAEKAEVQLSEAQAEIDGLQAGQYIRQQSVEVYQDLYDHWKDRAEKAESENATLRAEIAIYKGSLQSLNEQVVDLKARLKQPAFLEVKTCETCSFGDIDKHNAPCCWCGGSSHWQAIKAACEDKHE